MFKEEYKQHYDNIHPSQELIEKTKKLALEQYQKSLEEDTKETMEEMEETGAEEQVETVEVEEEKIIPFVSKKNMVRILGGVAAGIAIIVSGFYFGNTLQQEQKKIASTSEDKATPEVVSEQQNTPSAMEGQEEESASKKKKKKEQKQKQVKKAEPNELKKLAMMSRSGGVRLDYASGDTVIFHGNFGIIVYSLSSNAIVANIPAEEYIVAGAWETETVQVSADGNTICWYNSASSQPDDRKFYDRSTGKIETGEGTRSIENSFTGVQSVLGNSADVYTAESKVGTMVSFGNGTVCQLMYQAPGSNLQASLAVSVVNVDTKSETLYAVFGSMGKELAGSNKYGGYYNENGQKLFVNEEETEQPHETEQPQPTGEVEEPIPKETKKPEEKNVKTSEPESVVTEEPEVEEEEKIENNSL